MQMALPTPAELEQLLLARLNLSPEDQKEFLAPTYRLGDLFKFSAMEQAVGRIYDALKGGEYIGIYSDYDCDGIPGAVVLLDFFKKIGAQDHVHVYIPDRHDEGYGISTQGIDVLEAKGVSLIITVDVGITAIAQVADAQSRGIDVIVTDHHEPLDTLPTAYAIVHPRVGTYDNQDPCGAGVAFYLVCAFLERHRTEFDIPDGWEKWLLDLVGFATLSDMVPLTGENRMLASYGLHVMRKTRRIGLQTLLEKNNISLPSLTESDLTFTVAPRLNAASRMDTPMLAFQLLATDSREEARAIVDRLDTINAERKLLVARIVKSAHASLDHRLSAHAGELRDIIVVGNPEWRPAVLGLVANKLQETYNRSFFVWGEAGDGSIKGSCRMVSEHHAALLFQALPEGTLLHAGGHQAAGGFSTTKEQIHFLEDALNTALVGVDHSADHSATHDAIQIPLATATTRHLSAVRRFAPFGVGNPEPLFRFDSVVVQSTKLFGKTKEHIECLVRDDTGSATAFTFFADEDVMNRLVPGATLTFLGTLEAGWRGGVRIRIKELL